MLVAGTFDVLHPGHYLLLHSAFHHGERVEVWLSGDAMVATKAAQCHQTLQPFAARSQGVCAWLEAQTDHSVAAFKEDLVALWGLTKEGVHEALPGSGVWAGQRGGGGGGEGGEDGAVGAAPTQPVHPYRERYSVHALEDPLGSAVSEARYTAIVCSEETRKGCSVINERRAGNGIPPLKVFVVPVLADNTGVKLSSTALRRARKGDE